jgi:penicillin-binding protein 2
MSTFDAGDEERRRFSRRALLVGMVQATAFAGLAGRLYHVQIREGARYAPLADDNRLSLKVLAPVRGRILDRTGEVIAGNEESFRVVLQPARAGDLNEVVNLLDRIVPIAADLKNQLLDGAKRPRRSETIVVASDLTFEQVAEINLLSPQLPGVETETIQSRKYPLGAVMAHVTGHIGSVDRRALDDDPALRIPGIKVGKTGLERGMELPLRGAAGTRRLEVDARGRTIRYLDETPPNGGEDVVSSIDSKLQRRVMERLARETRASAVVMDVSNGEILALASAPTFDPNEVSDQMTPAAWKRLAEAEHRPMLDRATAGLYPPGSTFKLVTALAALDAGLVDAKEEIDCPGYFKVGNQTYRCWKRHGHQRTNIHKALRESCDVYFYEIARRAGAARLASMARKLGLGSAVAEGLELDKTGVVPDPDWKKWRFGDGWSTGDTLLTGIGQGFVLATPLQLAVLAARIATGKQLVPTLLKRQSTPREGAADGGKDLMIGSLHLDTVRRGMIACVNESGGTGGAARGSNGLVIAGKTGTSQVRRVSEEEDGKDVPWHLRDHALFVAYYPAEAPRYAIAAVVEHGGGGGTAAAPLVKEIIEAILADDPAQRPPIGLEAPSGRAADVSPLGRWG